MKNLKHILAMAVVATCGLPTFAQMYIQHNVNQAPQLVANAGASTSLCVGDSTQLGGNPTASGGTAPYTYGWSPSTGLSSTTVSNPMASPSASTSYQVLLTDANNCTSVSTDSVATVTSTAAWTTTGTLLVVNFIDGSINANTWAWTFGDGGTSNLQNPTHTYAAAGSYAVCLTINAGTGCEQTFCDSISVISVGVTAAHPDLLVRAYPNPTSGNQINFAVSGGNLNGDVVIELFDLQGRVVSRYTDNTTQAVHTVSRKQLSAGIYQYRVQVGEEMIGSGKVEFK